MTQEIVMSYPVRSAIGSFEGSLRDMPAAKLGARAIASTLGRSGLDALRVDAVIMGNVVQAGNGMNLARQAAVLGGIPVDASGRGGDPDHQGGPRAGVHRRASSGRLPVHRWRARHRAGARTHLKRRSREHGLTSGIVP